jgi:hypothetical protein
MKNIFFFSQLFLPKQCKYCDQYSAMNTRSSSDQILISCGRFLSLQTSHKESIKAKPFLEIQKNFCAQETTKFFLVSDVPFGDSLP